MADTSVTNAAKERPYEAILLFETTKPSDPDGMGHGEMRVVGRFHTQRAAMQSAKKACDKAAGAIGFTARKVKS